MGWGKIFIEHYPTLDLTHNIKREYSILKVFFFLVNFERQPIKLSLLNTIGFLKKVLEKRKSSQINNRKSPYPPTCSSSTGRGTPHPRSLSQPQGTCRSRPLTPPAAPRFGSGAACSAACSSPRRRTCPGWRASAKGTQIWRRGRRELLTLMMMMML